MELSGTHPYYATIVYPESAPPDWIERLKDLHIPALISPLHDKDLEKDGKTFKKPHYHVELIFESKKSKKQVQEVINEFNGVGILPVLCLGAYTRYLIHVDDPDKAQYNMEDVISLSGASFMECCRTNEVLGMQKKILKEITKFIIENDMVYFHRLTEIVLEEHSDWYEVFTKHSYLIRAIVVSLATEKKEERLGYI